MQSSYFEQQRLKKPSLLWNLSPRAHFISGNTQCARGLGSQRLNQCVDIFCDLFHSHSFMKNVLRRSGCHIRITSPR